MHCESRCDRPCGEPHVPIAHRQFDCGKTQQVLPHCHVVRHQHDIINDYDVIHEHDYNYYDVVRQREVVRHNDFTNHQPDYCCGHGSHHGYAPYDGYGEMVMPMPVRPMMPSTSPMCMRGNRNYSFFGRR
ncbi:MAG: hypothetical protein FWE05_03230 [Defluviitaleaceae bacterium]|nr:hypothetical protein [Defluviitaleaceae bacterium]